MNSPKKRATAAFEGASLLATRWAVDRHRLVKRLDTLGPKRDEAVVIPVILRSCEWHNAPFAKLQDLPKNDKPDVAKRIRKAVEELRAKAPSTEKL